MVTELERPFSQTYPDGRERIFEALSIPLAAGPWEIIRIAVAYATVAGARKLLDKIPADCRTEWVIGLDDALTQPDAVDLIRNQPGATVLIVKPSPRRRFHPKAYVFQARRRRDATYVLLGSANLTAAALSDNAETAILTTVRTPEGKLQVEAMWASLRTQGVPPTDEDLLEYRTRYSRARQLRRRLDAFLSPPMERDRPILASDAADLDPAHATVCWIECGNITGFGRQLELTRELALYFGVGPPGGPAHALRYVLSDGSATDLTIAYRGNQMWRLQLTNAVPEVRMGLRPALPNGGYGRSPYVAVFERSEHPGTLRLWFVGVATDAAHDLESRSGEHGTSRRTSARAYGWF